MKITVEALLTKPFRNRTYEDRLCILKDGKPFDTTSIFKANNLNSACRSIDWLTRSARKLYCWPCLLFSKQEGTWNSTGFSDMASFKKEQQKHTLEKSHIIQATRLKNVLRLINNTTPCRSVEDKMAIKAQRCNRERAKIITDVLRGIVDIICTPKKLDTNNRVVNHHRKAYKQRSDADQYTAGKNRLKHGLKEKQKNINDRKTTNHEFKIIPIEWLVPPLRGFKEANQDEPGDSNEDETNSHVDRDASQQDDNINESVNCKAILSNVKDEIIDNCYIEIMENNYQKVEELCENNKEDMSWNAESLPVKHETVTMDFEEQ